MPVNNKVATENFERYLYARENGHTQFVAKADMCEAYFAGDQWEESLRKRLEGQGKPALTINKIISTMSSVFGEQLENRADIAFRPAEDGDEQVATVLTKLYINLANKLKLDWVESEVFSDGAIKSRGFYDVRVGFSKNMRGEIEVKQLNPKNVLIDPDADNYDPDEWNEVFVTKWMTADDIATTYNEADAKILKGRGKDDFRFNYDSFDRIPDSFGGKERRVGYNVAEDTDVRRIFRVVERQHRKLRVVPHFVDMETGDMRAIPSNWDEERIQSVAMEQGLGVIKRSVKAIRWTVSVDDIVLFDDWSPYNHFTVVPYFPYFRNGRTIGLVENLLSPQNQLNKTSSQELHIVNTTANSGWKAKSGALVNMSIEELESRGAETGLVVELNDMNGLEKINPNQVPTGLDRISYKSDEYIKEISGVSDSMRGFDRADVAAKAIQAKQARGSINLTKAFDNLARTRHLLAVRILDLIQEYYTEERVFRVLGSGLGQESEAMTINAVQPDGSVLNDLTVGEYDVFVSTVPARESFEQSQFQEAMELRQLGIAIPDDVLIEHSHLNNKSEIAKRLQAANGGGEKSPVEQELLDLELQLKRLEAKEREADTQVKQANAALTAMRAKQASVEIQQTLEGGDGDGDELDRSQAMAEAETKLYIARQELALKREEMQSRIALAREEMQAKLELERERARGDMLIKKAEAAMRTKAQTQNSPTPKGD